MPLKRRATLASFAVLLAAAPAAANGRYPSSSHIVFDPSDSKHFVVSATIGLLETRDGGKTFGWRCETALGKILSQDLMVAVTASGTVVTTKFDGLGATSDGCTFRSIPEFAGKPVSDLTLSRSAPHAPLAFYNERGDAGVQAKLMRSTDDGATWSSAGPPLPADVSPLTIDVAPSDPTRIYLSATLDAMHDFSGVLLRSDDSGATFTRTDIPETAGYHLAWISAVHPVDANRLYVRVQDPTATTIWTTADGGKTFQKIFTGTGQLLGFAISPDGAEMAVGGPSDGIWIGASDGTNLARRSDVAPTCLAWNADGLYVCADWKTAGFSIGRSADHGASFQTVLRFDALCGQTACDTSTPVGMSCPAEWPTVAATVGSTCGISTPDASVGDASAPDAEVDTGVARDAAMEASSETDAGTGGVAPPPPPATDDGGCALASARGIGAGPQRAAWAGLAWLIFFVLRRTPFARVRL
jgi:photosystem II stability/assembly factor-like uncharacterized protein